MKLEIQRFEPGAERVVLAQVGEADPAVADRERFDNDQRQWFGRCRLWRGRIRAEQVGEVRGAVVVQEDVRCGRAEVDFLKNETAFENRDQLKIGVELVAAGKGATIRFFESEAAHGERQGVRVAADRLHGDQAVRERRKAFQDLPLEDNGHNEEADDGVEKNQRNQNGHFPPQPPRQCRNNRPCLHPNVTITASAMSATGSDDRNRMLRKVKDGTITQQCG